MPVNVGGYNIVSESESYIDNISPFGVNSLQIYLDAGNINSYPGTGKRWYDLSGNKRHFTWVSTPTFSSNGSQSHLATISNICRGPASNSIGIGNDTGYTIFMVFKQNSLVNTGALHIYGGALYSRGIFAHMTWGDNNIYFDQGGCCGTEYRTYVGSGGLTSFSVVVLRRETGGSTRTIWKNGTVLQTNTDAAANIDLSGTLMDLGGSADYGGDSSTWDANLNSFVVFNRGLSDTELQDVSGYFETRFNI